MRKSRRNRSETAQLVIVHSAMITALVAVCMLVQVFASIGNAKPAANRSIASSEVLILESAADLPTCAELTRQGVVYIETDGEYEITTDEVCGE